MFVSLKQKSTKVPYLVNEIILNDDKILFGYQKLINIGFHNHYNAYKVELDNVFFINSANFNVKFSYIFEGVKNLQLVNLD